MTDYVDIIKPDSAIGIIDADLLGGGGVRHPNLALMKISGYCKDKGCFVRLLRDYDSLSEYDAVFVSRVFTFTRVPHGITEIENVYCGGTGFYQDGGNSLPPEIEHHKPDYTLYEEYIEEKIAGGRKRSWYADYLDYSIGFTTRGCFRKCDFCVNKKYERAFRHSPVSEFLDESRPYIYLWDDNFLAYQGWEKILDELEATGKPFQFRQGLDVRLLNEKRAVRLARTRYCGDFIFAFDHIEDRKLIEDKLRLWRLHTSRGTRLYVLCAFDSQDEKDIENTFERIKVLMRFGCLPYIMRYESYKTSKWRALYVTIARWCNQPQFFKKKSFREFCEANQEYHKNKATRCSAYGAMLDFERDFPDIAERYFDLKYEEENMLYRYGRPALVMSSEECDREQGEAWGNLRRCADKTSILRDYYDKKLDIAWLSMEQPETCAADSSLLFEALRKTDIETIFLLLKECGCKEPITADSVPQFSNLDEVASVSKVLCDLDEHLTYRDLGIYLAPDERKNDVANRKYGENHGKLAVLMDLAFAERHGGESGFVQSPFASLFNALGEEEKWRMLAKLSLRIPVVRAILSDAAEAPVSIESNLDMLSESTAKRRAPNIMALVQLIGRQSSSRSSLLASAVANVRR